MFSNSITKTKLRLVLQSQKTTSLLITIKISLNIQINFFRYRSGLETTILASFLSKSLNYKVISSYLQKFSTLNIAKLTTSTRIGITLQTSVKILRAITMCSAFIPECRYDVNNIKLTGNVYCLNTMCSERLCVHKATFQSLGRSDHQRQFSSTCQVRKILF